MSCEIGSNEQLWNASYLFLYNVNVVLVCITFYEKRSKVYCYYRLSIINQVNRVYVSGLHYMSFVKLNVSST